MTTDKKHHSEQESQSSKTKDDPITISELFSLAQRKLPKQIWDFYVSGSDEGYAVRRNNRAYDKYACLPACFIPVGMKMQLALKKEDCISDEYIPI